MQGAWTLQNRLSKAWQKEPEEIIHGQEESLIIWDDSDDKFSDGKELENVALMDNIDSGS